MSQQCGATCQALRLPSLTLPGNVGGIQGPLGRMFVYLSVAAISVRHCRFQFASVCLSLSISQSLALFLISSFAFFLSLLVSLSVLLSLSLSLPLSFSVYFPRISYAGHIVARLHIVAP